MRIGHGGPRRTTDASFPSPNVARKAPRIIDELAATGCLLRVFRTFIYARPMRTKGLLCVISVVCLSIPANAAQRFRHVEGGHEWTPVSGFSGNIKEVLADAATKALGAMYFMEKSDDPRLVSVYQQTLVSDGEGARAGAAGELKLRDGAEGGTQSLDAGTSAYITAIQVCTNDRRDSSDRKIKGVRAWSAALKADGTLLPNATPAAFERNNCRQWHAKVSCAPGSVVTGVRGHSNLEERAFSGLSVRCTKLEPK